MRSDAFALNEPEEGGFWESIRPGFREFANELGVGSLICLTTGNRQSKPLREHSGPLGDNRSAG